MRESFALAGFSFLIALVCFGVLIRTLLSGSGIRLDGLLLLAVCLTAGSVFTVLGVRTLSDAGGRTRGSAGRR